MKKERKNQESNNNLKPITIDRELFTQFFQKKNKQSKSRIKILLFYINKNNFISDRNPEPFD
jgi:hypothetical protein